ncbi:MAG: preprotein translocase subunit YajC [Acidimicrobiia bacterium]
MGQVIFLAVTFLAVWLLFILPQQRRLRAHQALVDALRTGDEVMTSAGLYGLVTALDDEHVTLRIAPTVEVRFARGAIAKRVGADPPDSPADEPAVADVPSEGATAGTGTSGGDDRVTLDKGSDAPAGPAAPDGTDGPG